MLTSFLRPPSPPEDDDGVTYCETVTDKDGNVMHFMLRTPKRPSEKTSPEDDIPSHLI